MITIPMRVAEDAIAVPMRVGTDSQNIGMSIGAEYAVAPTKQYEGSYEFTPSEQTQTIEISGETATRNIVINPIPNNYGLITWNGATLTVS